MRLHFTGRIRDSLPISIFNLSYVITISIIHPKNHIPRTWYLEKSWWFWKKNTVRFLFKRSIVVKLALRIQTSDLIQLVSVKMNEIKRHSLLVQMLPPLFMTDKKKYNDRIYKWMRLVYIECWVVLVK